MALPCLVSLGHVVLSCISCFTQKCAHALSRKYQGLHHGVLCSAIESSCLTQSHSSVDQVPFYDLLRSFVLTAPIGRFPQNLYHLMVRNLLLLSSLHSLRSSLYPCSTELHWFCFMISQYMISTLHCASIKWGIVLFQSITLSCIVSCLKAKHTYVL